MRFHQKYIMFILLLGFSLTAYSQKPEKDFQIWGNFEVESPINKRWMAHVQHQSRFVNNASQYAYSYFDVGGLYRFGKNLRFTLNYVFANKQRTDASYSYRHQFEGYFTYRKKIGRFTFFDRLLSDMQFKDFNSSQNGTMLRDFYIRNKVTARYKFPNQFTP